MKAGRDILPPLHEKRSYVRRMFASIAPRYDLMNRLMTLGRDQAWRRSVVALCALPFGGVLLDVATGTGDIGYEALRQDPAAQVVGLDLAREMMVWGRRKQGERRASTIPGLKRMGGGGLGEQPLAFPFTEGDALALPFANDTFDAAASGFMMRNVVDIGAAFVEQARVVRPGGRVVCLEVTLPRRPVFGRLFRLYFFRVVPLVGGLISGHREAYTYLPESAAAFPEPAQLQMIMEEAGLHQVQYRLAMFGTVAIHWGEK